MDFEIESDVDTNALPGILNAGCPEGLRVLEAYEMQRPVRDLAFVAADMELIYDNGVQDGTIDALKALFARSEVIIQKRTKRKTLADVDLIPLIREISFAQGDGKVLAKVVACAQNPGLNPALIAAAIENELPELKPDFVTVRRTGVLDAEGQIFR